MTIILVVVALVVGIAFGGWLRGEVDDVRRGYSQRYWQMCAWDVYIAVRSSLAVTGCGLVGHRWKASDLASDIVECRRCGKADWNPKRVLGTEPGSPGVLRQMRLRGSGRSLWDTPPHPVEPHPNLLTEFGDAGYTVVKQ